MVLSSFNILYSAYYLKCDPRPYLQYKSHSEDRIINFLVASPVGFTTAGSEGFTNIHSSVFPKRRGGGAVIPVGLSENKGTGRLMKSEI